MQIGKQQRTIISALFLAMYLFVALVSIHFHQHTHQDPVDSHTVLTVDKGFSLDQVSSDVEKCFSCHMLYSNVSEIPVDFSVHFSSQLLFAEQFFAYVQQFGNVQLLHNFLRGPPTI